MKIESLVVAPGRRSGTVLSAEGKDLEIPKGWRFLAAGDSGLTRKVKTMGPHWVEQIKRGRRIYTQGIWVDAEFVAVATAEIEEKRNSTEYKKKREGDLKRREKKQDQYVEDFHAAIVGFLAFSQSYSSIAEKIARAVAEHATPIGSGTVARTTMIPIEKRAEAAVIAWMRHQTTEYDDMKIARVKGKRREVRRHLAHSSLEVLSRYRQGHAVEENCPLLRAISRMNEV